MSGRASSRASRSIFSVTEPLSITGRAANVLDGPLFALRHLAETLAQDPLSPALAAGEIVTTGTLTRAFPVAAGEEWTTHLLEFRWSRPASALSDAAAASTWAAAKLPADQMRFNMISI